MKPRYKLPVLVAGTLVAVGSVPILSAQHATG